MSLANPNSGLLTDAMYAIYNGTGTQLVVVYIKIPYQNYLESYIIYISTLKAPHNGYSVVVIVKKFVFHIAIYTM